jgi:hypothetical protein
MHPQKQMPCRLHDRDAQVASARPTSGDLRGCGLSACSCSLATLIQQAEKLQWEITILLKRRDQNEQPTWHSPVTRSSERMEVGLVRTLRYLSRALSFAYPTLLSWVLTKPCRMSSRLRGLRLSGVSQAVERRIGRLGCGSFMLPKNERKRGLESK